MVEEMKQSLSRLQMQIGQQEGGDGTEMGSLQNALQAMEEMQLQPGSRLVRPSVV